MILLLKISLILVLLLLIFTRYSCNIKIYAGAIFIFLLILLYQSHSCTFETICLSLLGIIYIITLSKFYPILISTRKRINSSLVFLISSALCLTTSFVFLEAGLTDPFRFSLLFTGIYLLSNAYINLDMLLGTLCLTCGIFFLSPMLTVIIVTFLCLASFLSLFIFKVEQYDN